MGTGRQGYFVYAYGVIIYAQCVQSILNRRNVISAGRGEPARRYERTGQRPVSIEGEPRWTLVGARERHLAADVPVSVRRCGACRLPGLSLVGEAMIFKPAHPGEVLRDYLGEMTVAEAAKRLGVTPFREF